MSTWQRQPPTEANLNEEWEVTWNPSKAGGYRREIYQITQNFLGAIELNCWTALKRDESTWFRKWEGPPESESGGVLE